MLASRTLLAANKAAVQKGAQQARLASTSTALGMFTEDERMLKESVKKWAETEVKPIVRRMDAEKKMVSALMTRFAD